MKVKKRISALLMSTALLLAGCASVSRENTKTASVIFDPEPMETNIQYDRMTESGTQRMSSRGLSAEEARSVDWSSKGNVDFDSSDQSKGTGGKTTIMVYMVGSDLESESGLATMDLLEMQDSGLISENVNLVVLAGGTNSWEANLSSDSLHLLHYVPGSGLEIEETELMDMSDPKTLLAFLNYCSEAYPAEQNGLVFWNHGGGPLFGYGQDEVSGSMMMMPSLCSALEHSPYRDSGLDFITFDACVMGSMEIASELAPYTDRLVVSAENVPGYGMDYSYLSTLNQSNDLNQLTRSMIDTTGDFYSMLNQQRAEQGYDLVFCEYDLTKANALTQAVDELFKGAADLQKQDPQFWKKLYQSRDRSLEYCAGQNDLTDLGCLTTYTMEYLPEESTKVQDCLRDMVVYGRSNMMDSTGVSIYFPHAQPDVLKYTDRYLENLGSQEEFAWFDHGLCEPLLAFIEDNPGMVGSDLSGRAGYNDRNIMQKAESSTGRIALPEDLQEETLSATMTVFQGMQNGNTEDETEYKPVVENLPVDIRDGELVFDPDPNIIIWQLPDGDYSPLRFRYDRQEDGAVIYQSLNTTAATDMAHFPFGQSQSCTIQVRAANDGSEARVTSFYATESDRDEDSAPEGKNDMSMTDYSALYFRNDPGEYLRDPSLPMNQQKDDGTYYFTLLSYSDEGSIAAKKASELVDCDLYYQIVLNDTSQGSSVFAFEELVHPEVKSVTLDTDQGTMEFLLFDDGALLVKYLGSDEKVTVPDTVEGKTVTKIGSSAFRQTDLITGEGARTSLKEVVLPETIEVIGTGAFKDMPVLETVNLPESLKIIGDEAFANTGLKEISLPSHLETIGSYAFKDCGSLALLVDTDGYVISIPDSLTSFGEGVFCGAELNTVEAGSGSEAVKVQDGLLLSKDGKTVYGWAGPVREELIIPDGVERIAKSAFESSSFVDLTDHEIYKTSLKKVKLPETLQTIDMYAFYGDRTIAEMDLPDSLVRIAPEAFGSSMDMDYSSGLKLEIPKNLSQAGWECLAAFEDLQLSVDQENPFYSVKDGKLMNKTGDREIPVLLQEN